LRKNLRAHDASTNNTFRKYGKRVFKDSQVLQTSTDRRSDEMTDTKQPESHTTLYDVCQEVLRLEIVNAELLEALKELLRVESTHDDGEIVLEVARHNAKAAIAKAEGSK